MAVVRSLEGTFYDIPEGELDQYKVPADQVKGLMEAAGQKLPINPGGKPGNKEHQRGQAGKRDYARLVTRIGSGKNPTDRGICQDRGKNGDGKERQLPISPPTKHGDHRQHCGCDEGNGNMDEIDDTEVERVVLLS